MSTKFNSQNLQNKKIAILGLGLENLALVKYISKHKIKCEITICDRRKDIIKKIKGTELLVKPAMTNAHIHWQLGKGYNKNLEKFDILFRSPGWPMKITNYELRITNLISSPMRLFFDVCPTKNIIGVTGTKGKGTTASLIYEILRAAGKRAWLGGNIGTAPFAFLDKIKRNDWLVLELSSFQLEDMTISPHIAVITNLYPEHLAAADPNNPNFHKTLSDYKKAKMNIVRWQKKNDYLITNYQLRITNLKSKIIKFKKSDLPSKFIGEHNKENVAAAVEVAKIVGVKDAIIKQAVANFKGLPHRLELVRELDGVKYYDDSFATTPESTIIALKSFAAPIILLLGGADKGADFSALAKEVKRRLKFAALLDGDATHRIKKELLRAGIKRKRMILAKQMKDAVAVARRQAEIGDVVLLSAACASFGMFKNYKERGDMFKNEVRQLSRGSRSLK